MDFNFMIVHPQKLGAGERAVLRLLKKEFKFMYYCGVVEVNSTLPHLGELLDLARKLWTLNVIDTADDERLASDVLDRVEAIAGKGAADYLWSAWKDSSDAYNERVAEERAQAWFDEIFDIEKLDEIHDYDSGFLKALSRISRKNNYDDEDVIFLHGYQLGMAAAKQ